MRVSVCRDVWETEKGPMRGEYRGFKGEVGEGNRAHVIRWEIEA